MHEWASNDLTLQGIPEKYIACNHFWTYTIVSKDKGVKQTNLCEAPWLPLRYVQSFNVHHTKIESLCRPLQVTKWVLYTRCSSYHMHSVSKPIFASTRPTIRASIVIPSIVRHTPVSAHTTTLWHHTSLTTSSAATTTRLLTVIP